MPPMTLVSFPGLTSLPAAGHLHLVAAPVAAMLAAHPDLAAHVAIVEIDPGLADTEAMTAAYDLPLGGSANCVVISGRRDGVERVAACVVSAETRADVNNLAKRRLDVRKASFHPMDRAVAETGMEYGGITPIGLPPEWRLFVDERLLAHERCIIGGGVRGSKILLPGSAFAAIPQVEIVSGLGI
jgi:prolyl-tRNA editing enzyme YbaK/EbsC (Cys-tRNA(Pro) deacylase)